MTEPNPLTKEELERVEDEWRLGDLPSKEKLTRLLAYSESADLERLKALFLKGFEQ